MDISEHEVGLYLVQRLFIWMSVALELTFSDSSNWRVWLIVIGVTLVVLIRLRNACLLFKKFNGITKADV